MNLGRIFCEIQARRALQHDPQGEVGSKVENNHCDLKDREVLEVGLIQGFLAEGKELAVYPGYQATATKESECGEE